MARRHVLILISITTLAVFLDAPVRAQDIAFGGVNRSGSHFVGRALTDFGITRTSTQPITGLGDDERLAALTRRPANELVYATILNPVTDELKVYEVDLITGVATMRLGPFPVVNDPDTLGGGAINPDFDALRTVLSNGYHGVFNFDGTFSDLPMPFYPPGDPNEGRTPVLHNLTYIDSFFAFDSETGSVVKGPTSTGELTTIKRVAPSPDTKIFGFDSIDPIKLTLVSQKPTGLQFIDFNSTTQVTTRTFRYLAFPRFPDGVNSFSYLTD